MIEPTTSQLFDCPFENIEKEYLAEHTPLCEKLKTLSFSEQRLLIMYAELLSTRKVAKAYQMSHETIRREINKIKTKLQ